jgi:predicted nucleotidyltransferase component of viral defense system
MRATQIRARLREYAKANRLEAQIVLNDFARERFLARLSTHLSLQHHVLLKGGFLLQSLLGQNTFRPTRDLDLGLFRRPQRRDLSPGLWAANEDVPQLDWPIERILVTVARIDLDDGLVFSTEDIHSEPIRDGQRYGGGRVALRGDLGGARVHVFIDTGEGDVVSPRAEVVRVPVLLDAFPVPNLLCVPVETVVAEKLDALLELGLANSRLKDYFDLWLLASRQPFDLRTLTTACRHTRRRRGRGLLKAGRPEEGQVGGLSPDFVRRNSSMWRAKWVGLQAAPDLQRVIELVSAFVAPLLDAMAREETALMVGAWTPGGPWREGE